MKKHKVINYVLKLIMKSVLTALITMLLISQCSCTNKYVPYTSKPKVKNVLPLF